MVSAAAAIVARLIRRAALGTLLRHRLVPGDKIARRILEPRTQFSDCSFVRGRELSAHGFAVAGVENYVKVYKDRDLAMAGGAEFGKVFEAVDEIGRAHV